MEAGSISIEAYGSMRGEYRAGIGKINKRDIISAQANINLDPKNAIIISYGACHTHDDIYMSALTSHNWIIGKHQMAIYLLLGSRYVI